MTLPSSVIHCTHDTNTVAACLLHESKTCRYCSIDTSELMPNATFGGSSRTGVVLISKSMPTAGMKGVRVYFTALIVPTLASELFGSFTFAFAFASMLQVCHLFSLYMCPLLLSIQFLYCA